MSKYIDAEKIKFNYLPLTALGNQLIAYASDINKMEAEDVAPVIHAHWILVYTNSMVNYQHMFQCSKCKNAYWMYKDKRRMWKYCPHCGAKMDEEVVTK